MIFATNSDFEIVEDIKFSNQLNRSYLNDFLISFFKCFSDSTDRVNELLIIIARNIVIPE